MSPRPRTSISVAALLAAALVVVAGAATPNLAQATSYRYWSYWLVVDGEWTFSAAGAALRRPADGSVEGWRFATSGVTGDARPRASASFEAVCAGTQPEAGSKRVALVVDPGVASDAPPGETPPGAWAMCVVATPNASGYDILRAAAQVRTDRGLICAINAYPERECAVLVQEPSPTASPTPSPSASSTPTASKPTTPKPNAPRPSAPRPSAPAGDAEDDPAPEPTRTPAASSDSASTSPAATAATTSPAAVESSRRGTASPAAAESATTRPSPSRTAAADSSVPATSSPPAAAEPTSTGDAAAPSGNARSPEPTTSVSLLAAPASSNPPTSGGSSAGLLAGFALAAIGLLGGAAALRWRRGSP